MVRADAVEDKAIDKQGAAGGHGHGVRAAAAVYDAPGAALDPSGLIVSGQQPGGAPADTSPENMKSQPLPLLFPSHVITGGSDASGVASSKRLGGS